MIRHAGIHHWYGLSHRPGQGSAPRVAPRRRLRRRAWPPAVPPQAAGGSTRRRRTAPRIQSSRTAVGPGVAGAADTRWNRASHPGLPGETTMKRRLLVALLALGPVGGYGAGFDGMTCRAHA